MGDATTGCVHRENYSVRVGVGLNLHIGPPEGQRYRRGASGFVVFGDGQREQGFQDWCLMENGVEHYDPCPHRPAWVRSSLAPPNLLPGEGCG